MPITEEEREAIEELIKNVNSEVNNICEGRDDVLALLRIHESVNSDTIENSILADAKAKAKTAAQAIVDML